MIAGHLGVAAAAWSFRTRTKLPWLAVAAFGPDILDVAYVLLGVCNPSGLYSHTLPAAVLLATVMAGAALLAEDRATAAMVFVLVIAHLPFDWPTGQKLFWPGGEIHGLGWYRWPLRDFLIEAATIVAGLLLLLRAEPKRWRRWAIACGVAALASQAAIDASGALRKPSACTERSAHG